MITIHFAGHRQPDLVRELAGIVGDIRALSVTASGVTVPDHVAYEWLTRRTNSAGLVADPGPAPAVEVTILPPAFADTDSQAEDVGGLKRPVETLEEPPPPRRPGRPRKEIR